MVLSGAAGLGKSRLAAEAAGTLDTSGVRVARVAASPASVPMPLAPLVHLVGDATGADAVTAVLSALGADRRRGAADPVLVVDDLHALDDASATVIHQLVVGGQVRVLATRRSGTPVGATVDRLFHESDVATIEVGPMPDADLLRLVESALGGVLDPRSRELLRQMSAGNPLYAHEIVEGSIAVGRLVGTGGVWSLDGSPTATPLLEEVVLARLHPLSGHELEAMEMLAVGGALDDAMLEGVGLGHALERLERLELIVSRPGEAGRLVVDVAHPLHRELLRARLGPIARLRIARALAAADGPPAANRPRGDNVRSAVWHSRGGLPADADQLVAAAQHILRAGDPALAAEVAVHADSLGGTAGTAMLASWCVAQSGDHDRAIAILDAARHRSVAGWERAAIRIRIAEEYWWTGRCAEGTAELDRTEEEPGPWDALIAAQHGVFDMLDGRVGDARARCEPLLDHPHLWVRFAAAVAIGNVSLVDDDPARALAVCGALHAEATEGDVELVGGADIHLAIQLNALIHDGQLDLARDLALGAHDQAAGQPSLQIRAWAATLLARATSFTGEIATSARACAEAERLWDRSGHDGLAAWCAAGLAHAQVHLGAVDEAVETVARFDRYDRRGFGQYESTLMTASAWLAHAQGDRAAAARHIAAAVAYTTERGQRTLLAWAWHDAARLDLLDVVGGLDGWARPTDRFSAARFDLVHGRLAHDVSQLERAGAGFEQIGARLYAAEAYSFAAAAARRAGDQRDATRFDGLAGTLAAWSGVTTPPLAGRQRTGPLSAREREVARLAADGLTNRHIAERLIVSERTVENHLYRIFIKLGITGRDDLAGSGALD